MSPIDPKLRTSIAIATFNGEAHLLPQLDSLAAQTCLPNELVISDDQSTDNTAEIIESFARRAPFPVRFQVNEQRLGYRRNFFQTAQRCSGDIIFFSDQDDVWAPKKIETILKVFCDPGVLFVYHNAFVADKDGTAVSSLYNGASQRRLVSFDTSDPFHFSAGFTQAYRRELHEFDDLWPLSIDALTRSEPEAHDQWYLFLALMFNRVAYCDDRLVHYRQHGANVYGVKHRNLLKRIHIVLERAVLGPQWDDLQRAKAADYRSGVADSIAKRVADERRDIAIAAAQRYSEFARLMRDRHDTTQSPRSNQRIHALLSNIGAGAYRSNSRWHLRPHWLFGDIARMVVPHKSGNADL